MIYEAKEYKKYCISKYWIGKIISDSWHCSNYGINMSCKKAGVHIWSDIDEWIVTL